MVIWGAIWGLILGSLWPEGGGAGGVVGAIMGAAAGWTLRLAVRSEVRKQQTRLAGAPAAQPQPAGPERAAVPVDQEQAAPVAAAVPVTADLAASAAAASTAAAIEPMPAAPLTAGAADAPEPIAAPAAEVAAAPFEPPPPNALERLFSAARGWLFGGNTIVRMGVLILFVGLAFLAKYAVDNALLPPELRLAGIAAAGIALFVGGVRLRRRGADKLAYALTLQGAGVAVLYLTVFVAFRLYQFLPPMAAFAMLALVCVFSTVIALLQNAAAMAFIGFAGAFAAPLLVSTGSDNATGLFSYYLLLGVAIAAIAWLRAWRALNLLGFFATFGVATLWGALKYKPEAFASTEPFLIAFFLVYVAASLAYALRHSLAPKQAVDATLIFGTPLVAFGLQVGLVRSFEYGAAFSSLALGAFYLLLGSMMIRRSGAQREVGRWLAECFAALGLGFVTLAVPLALDARWTSAVWAAEGVGVYWMGRRQDRWLARAAGLALQAFAGISYLGSLNRLPDGAWPLANPAFVGALLLAGSALAIAHWARPPDDAAAVQAGTLQEGFADLERQLSPMLFWLGFLWWQMALGQEISRAPQDADGIKRYVFDAPLRVHLLLLGWLTSAFAALRLAAPQRARPWSIAATPAWFNLPLMLLAALWGMGTTAHVFESGGWLTWPLALLLHGLMLKRLDDRRPAAWWPWVHAGGVWLLVLLGGNLLVFAVGKADLWQTAWASVILLVSGIAVLLLLSRRAWFPGADTPIVARWPLDRFARAYLWTAAAPLMLCVALGCLLAAVHSDGNARPLPYVPLLNPTDLTLALGLLACAQWLQRLRASSLVVPALVHHARAFVPLAVIAFIAINTVWLRVAHHYAGVPWDADQLASSFLVQAGYSILWTLLALGLMVLAHRRLLRGLWMVGAGLLGLTVAKLLLVDLSNHGGSERIVVFIAVGVLMLVVGYFAPLPPATKAAPEQEQPSPTKESP
jgi:uncharacterized membrane protein